MTPSREQCDAAEEMLATAGLVKGEAFLSLVRTNINLRTLLNLGEVFIRAEGNPEEYRHAATRVGVIILRETQTGLQIPPADAREAIRLATQISDILEGGRS